jgi:hypothetical protein
MIWNIFCALAIFFSIFFPLGLVMKFREKDDFHADPLELHCWLTKSDEHPLDFW